MISSGVMPWDFALILLFLAAAVPFLGRHRIRQLMRLPETTKADRLALYRSTVVSQWIAAAVVFWRARARGLTPSTLALAIPNVPLVLTTAALLSGLIFANQLVSLRRLERHPGESRAILPPFALKIFPRDATERLAFLGVVLTVSLCEELIFRGFAQRVLENAFGGAVLVGIFSSAALFAVAHLYQGRRGLLATLVVGLIFAFVRSWTGSLVAPVAAHFTADLTAGLLAPARFGLLPTTADKIGR
jgi:uncharacterized protein